MIHFRNSKIGAQFWLFQKKDLVVLLIFDTYPMGFQRIASTSWSEVGWSVFSKTSNYRNIPIRRSEKSVANFKASPSISGWFFRLVSLIRFGLNQAVECFSSRPPAMIASIWVSSVLQPRPTALMRVSSWDTMPLWRNGNGGGSSEGDVDMFYLLICRPENLFGYVWCVLFRMWGAGEAEKDPVDLGSGSRPSGEKSWAAADLGSIGGMRHGFLDGDGPKPMEYLGKYHMAWGDKIHKSPHFFRVNRRVPENNGERQE